MESWSDGGMGAEGNGEMRQWGNGRREPDLISSISSFPRLLLVRPPPGGHPLHHSTTPLLRSSPESRPPEARLEIGALAHDVPDEAVAEVFGHQEDRAFVDAQGVRVDPAGGGGAGVGG